jgi:hypothetical protein
LAKADQSGNQAAARRLVALKADIGERMHALPVTYNVLLHSGALPELLKFRRVNIRLKAKVAANQRFYLSIFDAAILITTQ